MQLSVVTTMYYSAPYINQFYDAITAEAGKITQDYEIVIVNDGSPDEALDIAIELHQRDSHVRVIDLSRNFGHHRAIMTGFAQARGDLVFFIDCDLEIRPETLCDFYAEYQNTHADVVYAVQQSRHDSLADKIAGSWFYTIFNWLSHESLPQNLTTARLMSRRFITALLEHREREMMIGGLWVITGFKQVPITVDKASKGSSTYNFPRKINLMVNAITAFSSRPLIFVFYLGCVIILLSTIAAIILAIRAITLGFLPGWPSLIVSVWLLGGLTIFCLGIIGIYLSKIFTEVKQRPYSIIRDIYEQGSMSNELQPTYHSPVVKSHTQIYHK